MYEKQTFEQILQRMLDRVPSDVDKREGSIIYDALAPAAAELTQAYMDLDWILDETFADTASRQYLIKRAAERGIVPEPATCAVLRGEFNIDVPMGTRFNQDELNYIVTEKISDGIFQLQCETPGRAGNWKMGALTPVNHIPGLSQAILTELLIPGEDEEGTEQLRQRYFSSLDSKAFGGNVQDYKEKVNSIAGIGGVKVYPVWNGGGTVKLVIINSEFTKPSDELVGQVQDTVDPETNHGQGLGIAPVGHVVTVAGVTDMPVNISARITYQNDWSWEAVKGYAAKAIDDYFRELAKNWSDSDSLVVRISQVETRLLGLAGVLDISATMLNGKEQNLILNSNSIPKRGELSERD